MYRLKPFKTLDSTSKKLYIQGVILESLMALASLGLLIYYLAIGDPKSRMLPTIGCIAVFLAPIIFELIFKKRFSLFVHITYTLAMFFAVFLGCGLNMHGEVGPFDEISHFTFGYISSLTFFYFLSGSKDYDKQKPVFIAVMLFILSMGIASLWEIFEFLTDGLLGTSGIGGVSSSALASGKALGLTGPALNFYAIKNSTYIWDSITDMTLHLGGTIIFTIEFALHRLIKKPLFLAFVKNDNRRNRARYYELAGGNTSCCEELELVKSL